MCIAAVSPYHSQTTGNYRRLNLGGVRTAFGRVSARSTRFGREADKVRSWVGPVESPRIVEDDLRRRRCRKILADLVVCSEISQQSVPDPPMRYVADLVPNYLHSGPAV